MDSQGAATMGSVLRLAEEAGLTLRLARVKPAVRAVLERDGFVARLGAERIHGNVFRAVQAQREEGVGTE
jgi:sulfate permease, SulP family